MDTPQRTFGLRFLSREGIYEKEKPFIADQLPGLPPLYTNHVYEEHQVEIRDLRTEDFKPTLNKSGFVFTKAKIDVSDETFEEDATVYKDYYPQVENVLRKLFPEYQELVFMNYAIRERSPLFPVEIGAVVEDEQPSKEVHVDFSANGLHVFLEGTFRKNEHLRGRPFDQLK
ncbi:hypothetical protein TWF694_004749 [Orbilia ellipsospora]|uniref:Uncharacterized protein n=1 Tax=Orbilia ellipsospora TaxID=2528407 RepID=A0AAV9WWD8_9PEZI